MIPTDVVPVTSCTTNSFTGGKEKCGASLSLEFSLKETDLYHISTSQLREAGCCPVKLEDLDLDIDTDSKFLQQQQVENELVPPG